GSRFKVQGSRFKVQGSKFQILVCNACKTMTLSRFSLELGTWNLEFSIMQCYPINNTVKIFGN
ncbi:MAG: hypothetical protein WCP32_09480, partial [Bacteroidota bacterium]